MDGTVKVPGLGAMKKKTATYAGLGAVVLVLAIWWSRQRKASTAAASSSTAGTTGTDPNAVDPNAAGTGYGPYDTSQLGGGGGLSGYYYGSGGAVPTTPPGPGNFAGNAEWAQYVESYMINTLNADPATVGNAVGKYLTGQALDPTQQNIVHEAIAFGQQPPTAGAGGYPPSIRTTTTGGPPPGNGVTVPRVVGKAAGDAHNEIAAAGLTPIADPQQQPHWVVTSTSPKGGASVTKGTRVLITAHAPAPTPHPKPHRK